MTTGILALWNDCRAGDEDTYEAWYKEEHLPERLSVPGFKRGRRYRAESAGPEFFTYYEVETPDVLTSEAYLARLDDPSDRTREMMTDSFLNMSRTICEVLGREGDLRGVWAVTATLDKAPDPGALTAVLRSLASAPGIARAELWGAVDAVETSEEERLRGGDSRIGACVMVETFEEAKAREIAEGLANGLGRPDSAIGVYRLLCELSVT
ncbi:MAG: hypothetical protein AAF409_20280 [Pseudomonadota bacterium]